MVGGCRFDHVHDVVHVRYEGEDVFTIEGGDKGRVQVQIDGIGNLIGFMLHLLELRTLGFDIVATDDDPVKECPPSAIFEASRSKLSRICLFWKFSCAFRCGAEPLANRSCYPMKCAPANYFGGRHRSWWR